MPQSPSVAGCARDRHNWLSVMAGSPGNGEEMTSTALRGSDGRRIRSRQVMTRSCQSVPF